MSQTRLGIDIGGTGIKFGLVDLAAGQLAGECQTRKTPQPATPDAVGQILAEAVEDLAYTGSLGIGFPAVVSNNVVMTAINIDPSWIGLNVAETIADATERDVTVLNDADAARPWPKSNTEQRRASEGLWWSSASARESDRAWSLTVN